MVPRAGWICLRRRPIVVGRKSADTPLLCIKQVQLVLRWQEPVRHPTTGELVGGISSAGGTGCNSQLRVRGTSPDLGARSGDVQVGSITPLAARISATLVPTWWCHLQIAPPRLVGPSIVEHDATTWATLTHLAILGEQVPTGAGAAFVAPTEPVLAIVGAIGPWLDTASKSLLAPKTKSTSQPMLMRMAAVDSPTPAPAALARPRPSNPRTKPTSAVIPQNPMSARTNAQTITVGVLPEIGAGAIACRVWSVQVLPSQ